jgi:four helix bundle protein
LRILRHLDAIGTDSLGNRRGISLAFLDVMNPKADELKRRTFKFALAVISFCRSLRETWEGRELSDQLFRAGTRVGANYRAACRGLSHPDPALERLLGEAGELTAIFSQSQLTAKANAGAYASSRKRPGPSTIRQSPNKSANS